MHIRFKQLRDLFILSIALLAAIPRTLTAQGTTTTSNLKVCPTGKVDEMSGAGESTPLFFGFAGPRLLQLCAVAGEGNSINRLELSLRSTGSPDQLIHSANGKANGGPFNLYQDATHLVLWVTKGASTYAIVHCWNPRMCDDRDNIIVEVSSSTTAKKTVCADFKVNTPKRSLNELSACNLISGLQELSGESLEFDDSLELKVLDKELFKLSALPAVIEKMLTTSPPSR